MRDITAARLFRERLFIASPLNDHSATGAAVYIIPAKCRRFLVRRVACPAALRRRFRNGDRKSRTCHVGSFYRLTFNCRRALIPPPRAACLIAWNLTRAPTKIRPIDFLGARNEFSQRATAYLLKNFFPQARYFGVLNIRLN